MKSKRYIAILLSLILTASVVLSGCSSSDSTSSSSSSEESTSTSAESGDLTTINIGFPSSGGDWAGGVLALAEEKGYLDEYLNPLGYDVNLIAFTGAAPAIHEALVSGDLDYAYYAGFAGIIAKSNGIDTKLLAVTSFGSSWELVATTESGVTSIEDLKGKTISYTRGATPQMYVLKVLEEAGLTENDVQLVNATVPEGLSSLSTGAVDVAVVSYSQADSLVEEGKATVIHKGVEADADTYFEPMVLTGRTEFVDNNSDVNVAIIKAMLKAKDDIKADPDSFYELSAEKSGRTVEQEKGAAVSDIDYGYPVSLDETYVNSLKEIEDFEIDNSIITNEVDFDSWVDSTYLDEATQEYQENAD